MYLIFKLLQNFIFTKNVAAVIEALLELLFLLAIAAEKERLPKARPLPK